MSARHDEARIQRRAVRTLSIAQVFSGLGAGSTLALGSILAVELSGSEAWAGSVNTALTLGTAAAAMPLSRLAVLRGRRVALTTGLGAAIAGSALMVAAVLSSLFPLLLAGSLLVGVATAVNLQARFAVTDLADPRRRGRDLSLVVWAITVGAVAGPNMVGPGAVLAGWLGIAAQAGPFLISAAGMALGAAVVGAGLRPDPLLVRQSIDGARRDPSGAPAPPGPSDLPGPTTAQPPADDAAAGLAAAGTSAARPTLAGPPAGDPAERRRRTRRRSGWAEGLEIVRTHPTAAAAVIAVAAAHGVMVGIMSMTPLHLQHHAGAAAGHPDTIAFIGFTLSLHIAGMYALSPLMGWLTDRFGPARALAAGLAVILCSVLLTALLASSTPAVAAGLVLLGIGWSAATVSGSTLLVSALTPAQRVPAQGFSDTTMSLAGAVCAAASGPVMGRIGYPGLSTVAAVLALLALTALLRLRVRTA